MTQKGRRRQKAPYYKALFEKIGMTVDEYELDQVDEAGDVDTSRVYMFNDTVSCQEGTLVRLLPVLQEIIDDHKTFLTCFGGEEAFYRRLVDRTQTQPEGKRAA